MFNAPRSFVVAKLAALIALYGSSDCIKSVGTQNGFEIRGPRASDDRPGRLRGRKFRSRMPGPSRPINADFAHAVRAQAGFTTRALELLREKFNEEAAKGSGLTYGAFLDRERAAIEARRAEMNARFVERQRSAA